MTLRRLGRIVSGDPKSDPPTPPSRAGGATRGKMLRAKPPNVIGRGPLLSGPGFGVVLVCIVKDEADYLAEWLAYHIALGVDHIIIYDNGSTDGSADLLERYINHGLVTRIDWPVGGGQLAAYNHALRMFGSTAAWLAYYDVDEFLVPLVDPDIPSFLARFPEAADVRVPRLEFGYSGHRTAPDALTIDAYTQVANVLGLDPALPPRVKSIVRPPAVSAIDIHLAFPADEPDPGSPTETAEESVRGLAQLNHYYTRSFEEFEAKRFRGSATGRISRPAVPFDIPTLDTDTSAQRFSGRTRSTMEHLAQLEVRPYAYGSQLALEYFPRPNDLFRFAEFALANTAAGLEEPGRMAATRLKNLHAGIGIVSDLTDTGYVPVRDGLASSVHTKVLVEHMRGRIESTLSRGAHEAEGGSIAIPEVGPAAIEFRAGVATLVIELPESAMLRCYSLGFVAAANSEVRMAASIVDRDGARGQTVQWAMPASGCVAGVVEVEPTPRHGARLRVRLESAATHVDLYDLFAISTG